MSLGINHPNVQRYNRRCSHALEGTRPWSALRKWRHNRSSPRWPRRLDEPCIAPSAVPKAARTLTEITRLRPDLWRASPTDIAWAAQNPGAALEIFRAFNNADYSWDEQKKEWTPNGEYVWDPEQRGWRYVGLLANDAWQDAWQAENQRINSRLAAQRATDWNAEMAAQKAKKEEWIRDHPKEVADPDWDPSKKEFVPAKGIYVYSSKLGRYIERPPQDLGDWIGKIFVWFPMFLALAFCIGMLVFGLGAGNALSVP